MKNAIPKLLVLLLFASCSSPKYAYYFDHQNYSSGKVKKAAVVQPEVAMNTNESSQQLASAPAEQDLVLASAATGNTALKKSGPSAIGNRAVDSQALSKHEKKEFKKQVKAAFKDYKKQSKNLAPDATKDGDKNQLVALLLAIFLGGLGIHRFYLGRIWSGIAQILLLVLGFLIVPLYALAVWVLIDIILIATGNLKPKNGSYNPSL